MRNPLDTVMMPFWRVEYRLRYLTGHRPSVIIIPGRYRRPVPSSVIYAASGVGKSLAFNSMLQ